MYKNCVRSTSVQRQAEILDCFVRLMEAEGYRSLTIRHICQELELSRTVFYRYFETKEDLLTALEDQIIMELELEPSSMEEGSSLPWFLFWRKNHRLMRVLDENGLTAHLSERIATETVKRYVAPLKFRMSSSSYLTLEIKLQTAMYLMFSMATESVRRDQLANPELTAQFCDDFLHNPLLAF